MGTVTKGRKKKSVLPKRPWPYRAVKKVRGRIDRWIARSSLIENSPQIDPAAFPWTRELAANWRDIRAEAEALLPKMDAVPPLQQVSPDHRRIAVAVNADVVPRSAWPSTVLRDGDAVEVLVAVAGG